MQLTLLEDADGRLHRLVGRRGDPQLVAPLFEVVTAVDQLLPQYRQAVISRPVVPRAVNSVVELCVVAVISQRVGGALEEATRVHEVEVAELALDGQRALIPVVR